MKLKLRSQRFYKIALFEVWFFSTLKPNIICHDGREREREGEGVGEGRVKARRKQRVRACHAIYTVSYTHLTLPTNREV